MDRNALFGLDGLVKAVRPAPTGKRAAGELVDDHHLAVLGDHVVLVAMIKSIGAQALLQDVERLDVDRVVEIDAVTSEQPPGPEQVL